MKREPEFNDFIQLVSKYKTMENDITKEVWSVVKMGFYEFHREGLIETLEGLAKFMQDELITKMTLDQQYDMSNLGEEYEKISKKALTVPLDTKELMALKSYVVKTEDTTIPEMEHRLKIVRDNLVYYITFLNEL